MMDRDLTPLQAFTLVYLGILAAWVLIRVGMAIGASAYAGSPENDAAGHLDPAAKFVVIVVRGETATPRETPAQPQ